MGDDGTEHTPDPVRVRFGGRSALPPLHTVGQEPDPRFTLANERTFLAWNRTALALIGGGLAATQLLDEFDIPGGNAWLGVPLTVLGGALAFISYFRWYAIERALRESRPIPIARIPAVLGVAIALVAVGAAGLILFRVTIFGEHEQGWDPRFDAGLTRERTLLAWHRTSLAMLVNAGIIARGFQDTRVGLVADVVAVLVVGLAGFVYLTGGFRFENRFWHKRVGRARDRAFRTVGMGTTSIATVALVLLALV